MKKFYISVFIFLVLLICNSCSLQKLGEDNFPGMRDEEFKTTINQAEIDLKESIIVNPETLRMQAKNVAYTVEKDTPFSVTFLYLEDNGYARALSPTYGHCSYMNSYEYRELLKAELYEKVIERLNEERDDEYLPGEVIASILEWGEPGYCRSLCDLDGDGIWDYYTEDSAYFSESSNPDYPSRVINEKQEIKFVSSFGKDIIELDDIRGGETFSTFEKLLE